MVMAISGLGGVLYGYDIGIISGALLFMKNAFALSKSEMSLIVAAVLGGGSLATLLGGPFADRFGRKFTMLVSGAVFTVGVLILVFATGFASVLAGRLVQGIGVGLITVVVPLYIVEVVPSATRGRSVTLFQLFLTFGILLGYLVGYFFNSSGDWRAMFATAFIPGLLFFLTGLILPKSPRWLYRRGERDEARRLLLKTHTPEEAKVTLDELEASAANAHFQSQGNWKFLLKPGYRKAFFIALAIGILTQLTGINTLLQFNTLILQQSGLYGGATAVLGSVGVGLINFIVTAIALSLIDRLGRRPLLIAGTLGLMVSLLFIGLVHILTEPSTFQGYATLVGFLGFIVSYAIGPGVVVWLAISEIMPLVIRAKGMAIALFANSVASAGLAAVFLDVVGYMGYGGTFISLAFFVFLYFLVAVFLLPETKGAKLEEIELHFLGDISRKPPEA
jgi:sugar porter (SP) family MFS transporter